MCYVGPQQLGGAEAKGLWQWPPTGVRMSSMKPLPAFGQGTGMDQSLWAVSLWDLPGIEQVSPEKCPPPLNYRVNMTGHPSWCPNSGNTRAHLSTTLPPQAWDPTMSL